MKVTVRDLIVNAMAEARLVNRNQPIPGNLFVDAYSLFKKRFDQYSNTNYLSFIRNEVNFIPEAEVVVIGQSKYTLTQLAKDTPEFVIVDTIPSTTSGWFGKVVYNKADGLIWKVSGSAHGPFWGIDATKNPDDYITVEEWEDPDIYVDNLQEVVRCYIRPRNSNVDEWRELHFISYEDFYDCSNNNYVYSVLPIDDNHVKLMIKKPLKNYELKVIYNQAFEFGPDDSLNIPRQFVSLFTAALVYDLAVQFPRMSDTTVALLKQRLDELEENVRRSSSVNKFIGRDIEYNHCSYADGLRGAFLWR